MIIVLYMLASMKDLKDLMPMLAFYACWVSDDASNANRFRCDDFNSGTHGSVEQFAPRSRR